MSPLQHRRLRVDEELSADGMPVTRGSHRLRRALCLLMVAVAVPAAFATAPSAVGAETTPSSTADSQTSFETDAAACFASMEKALEEGDSCEVSSGTDLSGMRSELTLPASRDDSPRGEAGQVGDKIAVIVTCWSTSTWPYFKCRVVVVTW